VAWRKYATITSLALPEGHCKLPILQTQMH